MRHIKSLLLFLKHMLLLLLDFNLNVFTHLVNEERLIASIEIGMKE
jgi:hypothetical protein